MSYAEIPLTCVPNSRQTFKLTLGAESKKKNVVIELRLRYLDRYDLWLADVVNAVTREIIVAGMPLVLGVNLLEQVGYKGAGEAYMIKDRPVNLEHPNNKTLGSSFILIWGDNSE